MLKSRWNVSADLSTAWKESLTVDDIVVFVLSCGVAYGFFSKGPPANHDAERRELKVLADNTVRSHHPTTSRQDLVEILQVMANKEPQSFSAGGVSESLNKSLFLTTVGPSADLEGDYQWVARLDSLDNRRGKLTDNSESSDSETQNSGLSPFLGLAIQSPRSDYSNYDDRCFSGALSLRDYAACSLEDCGYCGHCDY